MTAVVTYHALGNPGGARGVKDVQRVSGLDWHTGNRCGCLHGDLPVNIPTCHQGSLGLGPLIQDAFLDLVCSEFQSTIQQRFVLNNLFSL
ncbi:MAG: hypothetical protein ACD_62C00009G0001 [uncultured bacterium]|nr:MAG: hypothetical protein ACD_62C00009G0001 [uncultured bacterium]